MYKFENDLIKQTTNSFGTVSADRGDFPIAFKKGKLNGGDASFLRNNSLAAVHWKDKWNVLATSSIIVNHPHVATTAMLSQHK